MDTKTISVLKVRLRYLDSLPYMSYFVNQFWYFMARCIQREIDNITSDESWALYLNTLIEAIWPEGKLIVDAKKTKSEMEKARTRREAVIALMDAFPGK